MSGEPVAFFTGAFFVLVAISVVQNLNFDPLWQASWGQAFERFRSGPDENARVPGRLFVHPFHHKLEIRVLLFGANHAHWLAGAEDP